MKPGDLPLHLQALLGLQARASKYGVAGKRDRTADGITFASKAEMRRYLELRELQAGGLVKYFLRQVPFHLPGGIVYRVDFLVAYADGRLEYEDVKGVATPVYKIKRRQVEALYPVKIIEIRYSRRGGREA